MPASRVFGARILRRAIRGTAITTVHQAIAFEAVGHLVVPDAASWEWLFLRHARIFALGVAAPDVDFRDFRNHFLFPKDGMWGGAAAKANCWHRNLVSALAKKEWENACYCAGVLSHYVIDAVHPLHTAQSQADNDAYAAIAYCTHASFAELIRLSRDLGGSDEREGGEPREPDTVSAAVMRGAMRANLHCHELLEHIDLIRAPSDPTNSLDQRGKSIMAHFVRDAGNLVARLIGSAIEQVGCHAPAIIGHSTSARALAAIPLTVLARWRHRRSLRHTAEQAASEYIEFRRVTHAAPAEIRVKRELYAREVLAREGGVMSGNVAVLRLNMPTRRAGNVSVFTGQVLNFRPIAKGEANDGANLRRRRRPNAARLQLDE